ncbi:MAG: hypothetical protein NC041_01725 [Bacteroides sp.]|nr:hypothetical protein [Prevotella sp.]MCM1407678.1 hypothetical protein [Treponema brennaborense]MCM1469172.1 hypothetical protein [Bacteroides sp.]
MKKIVAVLLLVSLCAAGMFAVDLGDFPKGTWTDEKWNAEWVFGLDSIQLFDAKTGDLVFDFAKDKLSDFKLTPSTSGLRLSFRCDETHRSYAFVKPVSFDTSIDLEVLPDWADSAYKVTMPLKK